MFLGASRNIYHFFSQNVNFSLFYTYTNSFALSFYRSTFSDLTSGSNELSIPAIEASRNSQDPPPFGKNAIWQMVLSGSRRACDTCHAWPRFPMPGIPTKFRKLRRRMSSPVRETMRTAFPSGNDAVWNIYDKKFSRIILASKHERTTVIEKNVNIIQRDTKELNVFK